MASRSWSKRAILSSSCALSVCPGQINNETLSQVGDLGKAYANIPRGQFIGCFLQGETAQKNRLADMDHEVVAHGRSDRDEGGQLPGRAGAVGAWVQTGGALR